MLNKKKSSQNEEAPFAAGANFNPETIQPFLQTLSSAFDAGFTVENIQTIQSELKEMKIENDAKEIGVFPVVYNGEKASVRVVAEIHTEEDEKEFILFLYSTPEIVEKIEAEIMIFEEELDI